MLETLRRYGAELLSADGREEREQAHRRHRAHYLRLAEDSARDWCGPGQRERLALLRREHEVAGLVARGLSDRRIAESLVVSPRTADGHVERILAKLAFASRTQIAAWVAEQR